ncbi:MAG: UMP kinase [Pseudomonadota bacterium]
MENKNKTIVISLGGSIIVPGKIQVDFLKQFKEFILKFLEKNYKFIVVAGGGAVARNYQKAAGEIAQVSDEDKDWLGIHATRFNAHLLRTIFKKQAYPIVLDSPYKEMEGDKYKLFIASGWRPGWSTDYIAVLLAERFKTKMVINASNIAYVHEKDIALNPTAKAIKEIKWHDYRKLIGSKWIPGMSAPFDPIAAKKAQEIGLTVVVAKGTDLKNLENVLTNKKFKGTIIS